MAKDHEKVLALFRLNTPRYFSPDEEQDLVEYLAEESDNYYLFEEHGKILGCGGINYGFDDFLRARVSWDMVHPSHQMQGIGKKLLLYRIEEIRKERQVTVIEVRTSQLAYQFYARQGFRLRETQTDFWAPGFDLYRMEMAI